MDNGQKEIDYLKHQIHTLESSNKRLQQILLENDYINDKVEDMGFNINQLENSRILRTEYCNNTNNMINNKEDYILNTYTNNQEEKSK